MKVLSIPVSSISTNMNASANTYSNSGNVYSNQLNKKKAVPEVSFGGLFSGFKKGFSNFIKELKKPITEEERMAREARRAAEEEEDQVLRDRYPDEWI